MPIPGSDSFLVRRNEMRLKKNISQQKYTRQFESEMYRPDTRYFRLEVGESHPQRRQPEYTCFNYKIRKQRDIFVYSYYYYSKFRFSFPFRVWTVFCRVTRIEEKKEKERQLSNASLIIFRAHSTKEVFVLSVLPEYHTLFFFLSFVPLIALCSAPVLLRNWCPQAQSYHRSSNLCILFCRITSSRHFFFHRLLPILQKNNKNKNKWTLFPQLWAIVKLLLQLPIFT